MGSMTTTQQLLRTAVAAVALAALPAAAFAQQRIDNRANNQANPQIGSGGYNDRGINNSYRNNVNDIIYGNVTAGREFRATSSGDPRAFRGETAGTSVDRFVRNSSAVSTSGQTSFNANVVRGFYGDSRGVNPGPGSTFVRDLGGSGFVQAPATSAIQNSINQTDSRLGAPIDVRIAPSLIGSGTGPGLLSGEALATPDAFRSVDSAALTNPMSSLGQQAVVSDYTQYNRIAAAGLSVDQLRQFRAGVQTDASTNAAGTDTGNAAAPGTPGVGDPGTGAVNPALNPGLNSGVDASPNTGAGRQLTGADAARRNRQLTELQQRLQSYESDTQRRIREAREASNALNQQVQAAKTPGQTNPGDKPDGDNNKGGGGAAPGTPDAQPNNASPGANPANPVTPNPNPGGVGANVPNVGPAGPGGMGTGPIIQPNPNAQPAQRPAPMVITSFSTGVTNRGLAEILGRAETAMKEGKFSNAMNQFDAAEQVDPGNGLILIGRANAELGATFYRRAERSLRDAFAADKSLLMARYDLTAMMPRERIEFVANDLRELAKKDPQSATPMFLLAYLFYSIGDADRAAAHLAEAERRSPGDPVFKLVREHWNLPAADPSK